MVENHTIHAWYIYTYTYIWLIFMVNVGKHAIHGSNGMWNFVVFFFCGSVFVLTVAASTTPPSHRTELLVESHGSSPPWGTTWPVASVTMWLHPHTAEPRGPGQQTGQLAKTPGGFVQLRYGYDKLNKLSLAYPFFFELDWRSERKDHANLVAQKLMASLANHVLHFMHFMLGHLFSTRRRNQRNLSIVVSGSPNRW